MIGIISERPAAESIYLAIARKLLYIAEKEESERHKTKLCDSDFAMQDYSMLGIVMSVMALEAFINVEAERRLPPKIWISFEKNGIVDKWRLLPYILKRKIWNENEQPFQDFVQLINMRNKMVHYKPKYEPKKSSEAGKSLFNGKSARCRYVSARKMMILFFKIISEPIPEWIEKEKDVRRYVRTSF